MFHTIPSTQSLCIIIVTIIFFYRILRFCCCLFGFVFLNIRKDLFDVHTVGIVCGCAVACLKGSLFECTVVDSPFLDHHILRLAEGGIAASLPHLLAGREVLAAPDMHVLGLLLTLCLPVVEVVEIGDYHRHGESDG